MRKSQSTVYCLVLIMLNPQLFNMHVPLCVLEVINPNKVKSDVTQMHFHDYHMPIVAIPYKQLRIKSQTVHHK